MISGKTKTLSLIGHPVEHSFSPIMHNAAIKELNLNYIYTAYDVHPDKLKDAIKGIIALGIKGANVTIPHKENVIQYLDEIDSTAKKMGAVNTIKNEAGYLMAKNTDGPGARKSMEDAGWTISNKKILLVGAGGVARALCYFLADAEQIVATDIVEEKAINLSKEVGEKMDANIVGKANTYENLAEEIKTADILINATPLGMFPKINATAIPKELLNEKLMVFDVVYNPTQTKLLREASEAGCEILGGLDMLVNQGVLAFEWWTGVTPNSKLMKHKIIDFLGLK
ncbi:MAG: shikimate dehydrogenase [Candidatus Lokiarchaeota archaeon]|nr:shikimate dehydrogenase [Candidatus Lokiarchaeota archaeon]MBD3339524.1 shikimate dehydrogenase [Candidatus Lokiarchaeota archaeon]